MPPSTQALPAGPELRLAFGAVAARYDRHAVLEREVADRLLERTSFQRRTPERVLDLGCGTGYVTERLGKSFRKAAVVGLDFAPEMCRAARARSGWFRSLSVVCADLHALPLADRTIDLAVANLSLQWSGDLAAAFHGLRRVLRPGGLLLSAVPGPGSLAQLRDAAARAAPDAGFRSFLDLHDLGDVLVASGFDEPVVDSERLTLEYRSVEALLDDLEATAAATHCTDGTALRAHCAELAEAWPRRGADGRFPLDWEIVYGAAFGPADGRPVRTPGGDVATFSVDALRRGRPPGQRSAPADTDKLCQTPKAGLLSALGIPNVRANLMN